MKNLLATLTHYKALKAEEKRLSDELKAIQNEIIEYMKTTENENTLVCGQYVATLTECSRKGIDEKALREKLPDVAKEFEKVTTYTRFAVK